MEKTTINIDLFLNNYINFVDSLSNKFHYDNNIKHILYIIVPAFIIKYGIINERKILNIFKNVEILIINTEDSRHTASFNRKIIKLGDEYRIDKTIFLNRYKKYP